MFTAIMTTSVLRHSERTQECFVGRMGISNVSQSEESVTLMTAYRLPHQASGSFIFVQDDILPFFCYGSRFFANIHNGAFCPVSPVTAALC